MKNYVKEYKGYDVPNGATHFVEESSSFRNHFCKVVDGTEYIFTVDVENPKWYEISDMWPLSVRNAIELPEAEQEWDGRIESMTGCWVNSSPVDGPSEWRECLVKFSDKNSNIIVVRFKGDDKDTPIKLPYRFVPLKTQQEKDREEFICKSLSLYPLLIPTNDLRELLGVSFDNGARFPEGEVND